jgi:hypothetical protein
MVLIHQLNLEHLNKGQNILAFLCKDKKLPWMKLSSILNKPYQNLVEWSLELE